MLIPVGNKDVLPDCFLNKLLQHLEFLIMDLHHFVGVVIDSTVCHLKKPAG